MRGVSITRLVAESVLSRDGEELLLHARWCNLFDSLESGESLLHVPCWNLSRPTTGGEIPLNAQSCNLCRRSSGAEPLLHARCCHLSRHSAGRKFLIHATCLIVRRQENTSYSPVLLSVSGWWRVSLTQPCDGVCLVSRRSSEGESLLHGP